MFWFTDKHLEEIMKYKTSKKKIVLFPPPPPQPSTFSRTTCAVTPQASSILPLILHKTLQQRFKGTVCNFYSHLVVKFDFAFKLIYAL